MLGLFIGERLGRKANVNAEPHIFRALMAAVVVAERQG